MWKNQFLGQRKMTKIKAMTNMAEGITEKQLLLTLTIPFLNCQWHSVTENQGVPKINV